MKSSPRRFFVAAMLISLSSVALRFALVLWIPTVPTSDFWSYFERAENLADSGTYEAIRGRPDASFPPGYPLLLAPAFAVTSDHLQVAKALNVLLSGVAVFLMALVGRQLGGEAVGLLAAGILALYPTAAMTPLLIASENLFLPLLLGYLLLLLRNRDAKSSILTLIGAGVLSGLLTLTRSIAYPLWLLWPISFIRTGLPKRRILTEAVLVAVIANVILIPWAFRNWRTLGVFTPFTSTSGQDLFIGNNPNAPGYWYPFTPDIEAVVPGWSAMDVMGRDRSAGRAASAWIASHPSLALGQYLNKWGIMLRDETFVGFFAVYGQNIEPPWPATDVLNAPHPLLDRAASVDRTLNWSYFVLSLLEVAGILLFLKPSILPALALSRRKASLLAATGAFFPLSAALFHVSSRYRWPLTDSWMPFAALTLLAVASLVSQAIARFRASSGPA